MNENARDLEVPAEPLRLRGELRAHVLADPIRNSARLIDDLSTFLDNEWRAALAARSITRQQLKVILIAYEREIWLWMAGNRSWNQMIAGLVGRVERSARAA